MYLLARYLVSLFVFLLPTLTLAASVPQEGIDYLPLPPTVSKADLKKGQTEVLEFFNYGCPACNNIEPTLENWLAAKPKNIVFDRVPVVFHKEWEIYAKAYYVAKALNVVDKITPALFAAVHQENRNLGTEKAMTAFFAEHGVRPGDFSNVYNFSPGIDAQLMRGDEMMREYLMNDELIKKYNWVPVIPTFIVNRKYLVSRGLPGASNVKVMQVINYLIQKEQRANENN